MCIRDRAADSRSDTAGCRQVDFTVGSNLACLDDGNIHFSHETVTQFLKLLLQCMDLRDIGTLVQIGGSRLPGKAQPCLLYTSKD